VLSRSVRCLLAAALLAALAGCGSGNSGHGSAQRQEGQRGAGFPTSVTGNFGTTTVASRPVRVVAMSWMDADFALSLGVKPVGMARTPDSATGINPWTASALGDTKPALFTVLGADPMEQVAALRPDVILAAKDYNLASSYPDLSQLAPVVTYVAGPNSDPWQQDFGNVATALGLADRGKAVVADIETRIAQAKAGHPELAGKTFSYVISPKASGLYTVNSNQDVSARLLSQLGLVLNPKLLGLPPSGLPGRSEIGAENFGMLDADLVLAVGTPAQVTDFAHNPVVSRLPSVRRGALVSWDYTTASALGFPSTLSLPWALDNLLPELVSAARA
jgi:iron complex transport system substrate-binding protein